jgi:predicted nucleotide-binding protein (sugar kinase/HSP70/actin superfamily)
MSNTLPLNDMTVANEESAQRLSLPLLHDSIQQELTRERERLMREAGLSGALGDHFKRPIEHRFTRAQREHVTILQGGFSTRHDELVQAGLRRLGYRMARVPTPIKADFQAGKEYGNNGQCNPTYFTVGALVNYLKDLRDRQGLSTEKILANYVFITAGACGPCRFGMYEAEYRLALRNSGFDGFRVLLFDQKGGFNQAGSDDGIEFNMNLFLAFLNALILGDLLNEVAYQIRPYEVVPGSTNAALAECQQICADALQTKNYRGIRGGRISRLLAKRLPLSSLDDLAKLLDQFRGDTYTRALNACRDLLNQRVEVDFTRPRPIVKVTGEFWAQTTEGDGNFRMFSFLEGEGAQVLVEPIGTWVRYLVHSASTHWRDRRGLADNETPPSAWNFLGRLRLAWRFYRQLGLLALADKLFNREYERLRWVLGGTAHALANQLELQRLGHPYYNSRSGGGEGHMEVAKNIYYAHHNLAHMVLSLKPFGCMPSTQSDGAQAAVLSHYPDMIYLPVETSGEGDVNAHSRVQMALGEAKLKCKNEFQEAVRRSGYSLEQIQGYVAEHRELRRPIQRFPQQAGIVGCAAHFVLYVASLMKNAID